MAHQHCWALTHVTTDPDGTQRAHFHCCAPACPLADPTFSAPADSYLAALTAYDATLAGAGAADPLPARWPPPVPHDPERLA